MTRFLIVAAILLFASAVSASTPITDESSNVITDESGTVILFPTGGGGGGLMFGNYQYTFLK